MSHRRLTALSASLLALAAHGCGSGGDSNDASDATVPTGVHAGGAGGAAGKGAGGAGTGGKGGGVATAAGGAVGTGGSAGTGGVGASGKGGGSAGSSGSTNAGGASGHAGNGTGGAAGSGGMGAMCLSQILCGSLGTCCDIGDECFGGACVPACGSGVHCGIAGNVCCSSGEVCVATACAKPGASCSDFFDCQEDEFCEPTLGKCLPQFPGSSLCEVKPADSPIDPVLKWAFTTPTELPSFDQGISAPLVVDLDKDGKPDVVTSTRAASQPNEDEGYVRALDGATGKEKWGAAVDAYASANTVDCTTAMVVADLAGDGKIAIVAEAIGGGLIAFNGDGSLRWKAKNADGTPYSGAIAHSAIEVADVDGDGTGEVALGGVLFDSNGVVLSGAGREASAGIGYNGAASPYGVSSILADVDLDGVQDLVVGNAAYRKDGSMIWQSADSDGFPAIADLDKDHSPELVVSAAGNLLRVSNASNGVKLFEIALGGANIGPPVIADFDGDGTLEIGIQRDNPCNYSVYKYSSATGLSEAWTTQLTKCSGFFAATAFDFNGDGAAEVVTHDDCYVTILDGKTGNNVLNIPAPHDTWSEFVSVADVDGDGSADLIFTANDFYHQANPTYCPYPPGMLRHGVFAYSGKGAKWMPTRHVWNQQSYHITNIKADGSLPKPEPVSWGANGYNNYRVSFQGAGVFNAPDLQVDLEISTAVCPASIDLRARVQNGGSLGVAKGVVVDFYAGKDATGTHIATLMTQGPILPGGSELVETLYPVMDSLPHDFFVTVDGGNGMSGSVVECNEANNQSAGNAGCEKI